jgi:membrane-bound lytic murein transglycosylase D
LQNTKTGAEVKALVVIGLVTLISAVPYELTVAVPPPNKPIQFIDVPETELLPPRRIGKYTPLFEQVAAEAGIPIEILESVAWVESRFNAAILSKPYKDGSVDMGLFQFHSKFLPDYRRLYGAFDPMIPEQATRVAAAHLKYLYSKYGAWTLAVEKWNAGEGGENPKYVGRVYEVRD